MPDPYQNKSRRGDTAGVPKTGTKSALRGQYLGYPVVPNGGPAYGGSYGSTKHMERVEAARRRTQAKASGGGSGEGDLGQLEQMLGAMDLSMPSLGDLRKQAQAMASGEFDPQIGAIKNDMSRAKKRAGAAKKDIDAIYDDLVHYYEGKAGPVKGVYKAAKADAKNRSNSLKAEINADYSNRLKEQVDLYKNLGLESAVPSATEGQYADQANQLAVADNTGSAEEAALFQEENADLNYWREGGGAAKTEGADLQSDITMQLNDYLNKQGGALAGLEGQKGAAYNMSLMKLQSDAAQSQMQQQNELWDRMMDFARLKKDYAKQSMKSASGSGGLGPEGLMGAMMSLGGDQRLGNAFQQALTEGATWKNTPQAKLYYGGHSPSSPEEMAQMIRDNAANKGMSPSDQLALWQAALRYFGRYK